MATSLFQKLIKNQSRFQPFSRTLTAAAGTSKTHHHLLFPLQPLQTHQSTQPKSQNPIFFDPSFSVGIYPSFSFNHFLNPIAPYAPDLAMVSEVNEGDEGSKTMWADSVKKKRKKKMNKHKLKKLRKRLRRKT